MKHAFPYFYGALLGGAIGDALGAPIEFMRFEQVMGILGTDGIRDYIIPPGQKQALITDDTQMMMFTAEGLLRSATRAERKNKERTIEDITITVFRAYLRWLYTQGLQTARWSKKDYDGWLVKISRMHAYREPGVTCLTALGKGVMGTVERPVNNSIGCGCVMRVVPVGLVEEKERVFEVAVSLAAITHGHPSAYLSAGTLAYIIKEIVEGQSIEDAVKAARDRLSMEKDSNQVVEKINLSLQLAQEGKPSRNQMEQIGEGGAAHEVLAMAIYAALCYPNDYLKGVLLGVNHSGDSDSVGGITGCILGCNLGIQKIPSELTNRIELHHEIQEVATDLLTFHTSGEEWLKKYPAW